MKKEDQLKEMQKSWEPLFHKINDLEEYYSNEAPNIKYKCLITDNNNFVNRLYMSKKQNFPMQFVGQIAELQHEYFNSDVFQESYTRVSYCQMIMRDNDAEYLIHLARLNPKNESGVLPLYKLLKW